MLLQLLVGHLPFKGNTQAELMGKQLNESVPVQEIKNKQLAEIVARATEKNQENRYQSAAEFRAAIDKIHTQIRKTGKKKPKKQPILEQEQIEDDNLESGIALSETSAIEVTPETDSGNNSESSTIAEDLDNLNDVNSDDKSSLIKEIALWSLVALGGFGLGALIQYLL
jgi:serine/threonine-protein kinase